MGIFKMVAGKLVEVSAEELAKKTAKKAAKKAAPKKAAPKKAAAKKGRPTKQQKAAATRAKKKAASATPAKKKMAQKPGTARRKDTRMSLKGMAPEKAKELRGLVAQVRKEMAAQGKPPAKPIPSRIPTKTPPSGPTAKGAFEEGPNTVLPSKIEVPPKLKDYSRAQLRRLVSTGQVRIVKNKSTGKFEAKSTGKFAPPASMIREAAGEGPRGMRAKTIKPSERRRRATKGGEPTTFGEMKRRQKLSARETRYFRNQKEVMKDAGKDIRDRIELVEKRRRQGLMSATEAKRRIKKIKQSAMKTIEQKKKESGRKGFESSPVRMGTTTAKRSGGKVTPPKYKGFSKLPEKVQQNMDPQLAAKYEKGGKIKRGAKKAGKTLGKLGSIYSATPAGMMEMLDLLQMGINMGLKKGGSVKGGGAALRGHGKAMRKKGK